MELTDKQIMKYWTEKDLLELKNARTFEDVGKIAIEIQNSMPDEIGHLCGPMSTGGLGNIEDNLINFENILIKLSQDYQMYNQLPLEDGIYRIMKKLKETNSYNPEDLLNAIYKPLFNSKKLKKVFFIHDWESSHGTTWENNYLKENRKDVELIYLEKDYLMK
jgi:hypothetical protein